MCQPRSKLSLRSTYKSNRIYHNKLYDFYLFFSSVATISLILSRTQSNFIRIFINYPLIIIFSSNHSRCPSKPSKSLSRINNTDPSKKTNNNIKPFSHKTKLSNNNFTLYNQNIHHWNVISIKKYSKSTFSSMSFRTLPLYKK